MTFHVANDLLYVRLHVLYLAVFLWMERRLLFNVVLLLDILVLTHVILIMVHEVASHEELLLCLGTLFDEKVWTEAIFVKFWSAIVWLEMIIDVDERELCHTVTVHNLWVLEPSSVRESRYTEREKKQISLKVKLSILTLGLVPLSTLLASRGFCRGSGGELSLESCSQSSARPYRPV